VNPYGFFYKIGPNFRFRKTSEFSGNILYNIFMSNMFSEALFLRLSLWNKVLSQWAHGVWRETAVPPRVGKEKSIE